MEVLSRFLSVLSQQSKQGEYSVGIVGSGTVSKRNHIPVVDALPETSLAYVADIDQTAAERAAKIYECEVVGIDGNIESLPPCDIALLAIPVGVRESYIEEFGDRGTPVFCEKPFAPDITTHKKFERLSSNIGCNYMRTCFDSIQQLCEVHRQRLFGQVEEVKLHRGSIGWSPRRSWASDASMTGGGVMMLNGCHELSQLVAVFGDYDLEIEDSEIVWQNGIDVDVKATIRANNSENSFKIDYQMSYIRNMKTVFRVDYESADVLLCQTDPSSDITAIGPDGERQTLQTEITGATSVRKSHARRWQAFIEASEKNTNLTEKPVTKMMDSIYNTAGDQREINR